MPAADRPARFPRQLLAVVVALVLVCIFLALGTWQVQRRASKLELIARVAQRVGAAPVDAPAAEPAPVAEPAPDVATEAAIVSAPAADPAA